MDLATLTFAPFLVTTTTELATDLRDLCRTDPETARQTLRLSARQLPEVEANAHLFESPTTPALSRYTGVLYEALDVASLTAAQQQRAAATICIGSALFGMVAAQDLIPHYRLSATSSLGGTTSVRARWAPAMRALADAWAEDVVLDLRSGAYRALGPLPHAWTVAVVAESAAGTRSVVTHFNKHYKGVLARALVASRARLDSIDAVCAAARRAGLRIEVPTTDSRELILVVERD